MNRLTFRKYSYQFNSLIEISPTLKLKSPIVALESTIITHGMPYPQNVQTALEVENIIRSSEWKKLYKNLKTIFKYSFMNSKNLQNSIPATIAIIKGKIKIGLSLNDYIEVKISIWGKRHILRQLRHREGTLPML